MQSRKAKAFKNLLRNYLWTCDEIRRIKSRIDDAEYLMSNVKGVRFDKEHGGFISEEQRVEMITKRGDEVERLKLRLVHLESDKRIVDETLEKFEKEAREVAWLVYVRQSATYESLSQKLFCSASGLRKRVEKEIERNF